MKVYSEDVGYVEERSVASRSRNLAILRRIEQRTKARQIGVVSRGRRHNAINRLRFRLLTSTVLHGHL